MYTLWALCEFTGSIMDRKPLNGYMYFAKQRGPK